MYCTKKAAFLIAKCKLFISVTPNILMLWGGLFSEKPEENR